MNTLTKQVLAALVLASAVTAPALANIRSDVQESVTGSGNINVSVDAGVATLTGYGDWASKAAAERAALKSADVERVLNLILTDG